MFILGELSFFNLFFQLFTLHFFYNLPILIDTIFQLLAIVLPTFIIVIILVLSCAIDLLRLRVLLFVLLLWFKQAHGDQLVVRLLEYFIEVRVRSKLYQIAVSWD